MFFMIKSLLHKNKVNRMFNCKEIRFTKTKFISNKRQIFDEWSNILSSFGEIFTNY